MSASAALQPFTGDDRLVDECQGCTYLAPIGYFDGPSLAGGISYPDKKDYRNSCVCPSGRKNSQAYRRLRTRLNRPVRIALSMLLVLSGLQTCPTSMSC